MIPFIFWFFDFRNTAGGLFLYKYIQWYRLKKFYTLLQFTWCTIIIHRYFIVLLVYIWQTWNRRVKLLKNKWLLSHCGRLTDKIFEFNTYVVRGKNKRNLVMINRSRVLGKNSDFLSEIFQNHILLFSTLKKIVKLSRNSTKYFDLSDVNKPSL